MNTPPAPDERFVGHKIRVPVFEGPLDLLLFLVRAHRYDICDIPIAQITSQFIEYLTLMREVEADYAGDFLVTAATLMQIKARMLLPKAQSQNEDILDEESVDPRAELVEQLLELQRIHDAADDLKQKREEWTDIFRRPVLARQLSLFGDEEDNISLSMGRCLQFRFAVRAQTGSQAVGRSARRSGSARTVYASRTIKSADGAHLSHAKRRDVRVFVRRLRVSFGSRYHVFGGARTHQTRAFESSATHAFR